MRAHVKQTGGGGFLSIIEHASRANTRARRPASNLFHFHADSRFTLLHGVHGKTFFVSLSILSFFRFFYRYIPGFVPPRSIRSARGVHRFMNSSATRGRRCFFTGRDTAGENNVWPRRCHGAREKFQKMCEGFMKMWGLLGMIALKSINHWM